MSTHADNVDNRWAPRYPSMASNLFDLKSFHLVTGFPPADVRAKIDSKEWREGEHFHRRGGKIMMDMPAFERWVESGPPDETPPAPAARPQRRSRPLPPGATQLYRHFDAGGQLLYIGISLGALDRLRQHAQKSPWIASIVRVEIVTFPTRAEAESAERDAIKTERPLHNIVHRVEGSQA